MIILYNIIYIIIKYNIYSPRLTEKYYTGHVISVVPEIAIKGGEFKSGKLKNTMKTLRIW